MRSASRQSSTRDAVTVVTERRQRAEGRIAIAVDRMGARSGVRWLSESGSSRLRLPTVREGPPEAVLINTGGGITGGDSFRVEAELGPGADLVLTTAAAEKIYRAESVPAELATYLTIGEGARLDWVPQETILFDRARLLRSLDAEIAPTGSALLFEAVVFGRAASGEVVRQASYRDRWRIRRGGRLVFADTLRLEGDIAARLAQPSCANGARALATLLYVAPDAVGRIEQARALLEGARSECGASAWDGMLIVRWLAADIDTLRLDASRFMTGFRRRALPRVWHL